MFSNSMIQSIDYNRKSRNNKLPLLLVNHKKRLIRTITKDWRRSTNREYKNYKTIFMSLIIQ